MKQEIINNSGLELDEVRKLNVVGRMRNNWRQRNVTLYEFSSTEVISVGESFDGSQVFVCREPKDSFKRTLSVFPRTEVYN